MVFRDDVVFLIEEYTRHFGEPPSGLSGCEFPSRGVWTQLVHAIREALDTDEPIKGDATLERAA